MDVADFEQITDGASTTLMIGEQDSDLIDPYACWDETPVVTTSQGMNSKDDNGLKRNDVFRSRHDAGVHFLLADGAVRYISRSIDASVYRALSTINGGEAVGDF